MNFKERIDNINQLKNDLDSSVRIKSDIQLNDIFVKNKSVDQILKTALLKSKNVILLCQSSCDRTVVASYVRNLFLNNNIQVDILNDISGDLPFSSSDKVVVPEASVSDIVKIFELILLDYKSFVFTLNLKSFVNPIESLRVLLALNSQNLTHCNIEHLIGMSESLLVYVEKNEDGLFNITNVGKIQYKNSKLFLDVIYGTTQQDEADEFIDEAVETSAPVRKKEKKVKKTSTKTKVVEKPILSMDDEQEMIDVVSDDLSESENAVEPDENFESSLVENSDEQIIENDVQQEESTKKVNKYKLLKEKLKNKKKG